MGGIFGRKKTPEFDPNLYPYNDPNNDPFYDPFGPPGYGGPPPYPYGQGGGYGAPPPYGQGGGLGSYDPYDIYGYDPTYSMESYYGGTRRGRPGSLRWSIWSRVTNKEGFSHVEYLFTGMNQMSGMSPSNYGNYYMGNTTMQIMPFMMRKVAKYNQRMAMGGLGGGGFGSMPMMPMMPMMPCLPAAAPMIAAATPLPIAFSPLIQGMYPMASMNTSSWMTPSSFMSALSTGPMGYRPPASFEFPSNVGMVMPMPFGNPNPLLSMPSFGGFAPQMGFGGGFSCSCCYCLPAACPPPAPCPPPISFYPRPVSVPQPYPVPYPAPVAIPNIQQVPIPRPVTVVAPPIIAGGNQAFSMGAPLIPSQGAFSQAGFGQTSVMASNRQSTNNSLLSDHPSEDALPFRPKTSSVDPARRAKAQRIVASLANLGLDNQWPKEENTLERKEETSTAFYQFRSLS